MTHSANWQIATYCKSSEVVQLYLYTKLANKRTQRRRRRDGWVSLQADGNPRKGEPLTAERARLLRAAPHTGHFPAGLDNCGGLSPRHYLIPQGVRTTNRTHQLRAGCAPGGSPGPPLTLGRPPRR